MASLSLCLSSSSRIFTTKGISARSSSPSMSLVVGGRSSLSLNAVAPKTSARSGLLHCSLTPTFSSLSSSSGAALQFGITAITGVKIEKRRSLVVRAGKYLLCQTKRNRSRKSLARTHGFRRRMRTTSGRALLKRRRAKGRWVLCPKSNPNSGR